MSERQNDLFREACSYAYVSVSLKIVGIGAGILPGLAIYESGKSTIQGLTMHSPDKEIVATASFIFGGILLSLSLPSDVISGAKFTAFVRKSAEIGISKMLNH